MSGIHDGGAPFEGEGGNRAFYKLLERIKQLGTSAASAVTNAWFTTARVDQLQLVTGSNKSIGTLTLVAGTVTVANTRVVTASKIFLSKITNGGTAGNITVTRSTGVSFTVTSSSNTDTSTFDYLVINPAA